MPLGANISDEEFLPSVTQINNRLKQHMPGKRCEKSTLQIYFVLSKIIPAPKFWVISHS